MGSRRKKASQRHLPSTSVVLRVPRGVGAASPGGELAGAVDPFGPASLPPVPVMSSSLLVEEAEEITDEHLAVPEHMTPSGLQRIRQAKAPRVGLVMRQADDGSYEMVSAPLDGEGEEDQEAPQGAPEVPFFRRPRVQLGALGAVVLLVVLGVTLAAVLSGDDEPRKVKQTPLDKAAAVREARGRYEYVAPQNHSNKVDLNEDDGEEGGEEGASKRAPSSPAAPSNDSAAEQGSLNRQAPPPSLPSPQVDFNKRPGELRAGSAQLDRLMEAKRKLDEESEGEEAEEESGEEVEEGGSEEEEAPAVEEAQPVEEPLPVEDEPQGEPLEEEQDEEPAP